MTRFEQAAIATAKVILHVGASAAVTAIFSWVLHQPTLLAYIPVVNIVEVAIWKFIFPNDPVPVITKDSQPTV